MLCALALASRMTFGPPADAATAKPCASLGKAVQLNGVSVPVCAALYASGSAIRLPRDTTAVRYGVLSTLSTAHLLLRTGKQLSVRSTLVPKAPQVGAGAKSYSQVIYRAAVRGGKVSRLVPALFVPTTTPLRAYRQKLFIGEINNLGATDGLPASDFVRLDFSGTFSADGALKGTFANLTQSVRRNSILEPPAPCEAALLGLDQARNDWYAPILGNSANITMAWDPAMHGPLDSELVIYLSSGISYMTHSPTLLELMTGHIDAAAQQQFSIHGNPMGTPAWFTGSFQTAFPLRTC